ncbi:MAG: Chagasin family peptidase inhibitor [Verrucomicrobiota bacterium]|jgi:hypothetical protein
MWLNELMLYLASLCCILCAAADPLPLHVVVPSEQVTKVTVGEIFEVSLIGNPSTGRFWQAVGIPASLEQVGQPRYEAIPYVDSLKVRPSGPRPGAPMLSVFTFRAKSASKGAIAFRMASASGFETAEIKFVVQGK